MQKVIPIEEAKRIETELTKQGFDFEIGYDKEGLVHILCGEEDENKIQDAIDALAIPHSHFYWLGSFASDAIVEELTTDEPVFGLKEAVDEVNKMTENSQGLKL